VSSASVICASCGARIRADRDRCLRCGEPLQAAAAAPALPNIREWLRTSNGRHLAVGAVASLVLLAGVVVMMDGRLSQDTGGRPAASRAGSPARISIPTVHPTPQGELMSPATVADSVRLGSAAFTSGDFESAKIRYQQALQKKADDAEALNGLGLVLEREGQIDDALAQFTRAAAVAPDHWAYRFNLAHALGQAGKWNGAVDEYRAASQLFPDDYATQYNLALAIHKKGDDADAIPEFRKAIALAPREPSFHLALAMSLEKTGKTADAAQEYQQYLDMAPYAADAEKLREHLKAIAAAPRAGSDAGLAPSRSERPPSAP